MNYRKLLAMLLALSMAFSMTACGNKDTDTEDETEYLDYEEYSDEYEEEYAEGVSEDYAFGIEASAEYAGSVMNDKIDYTKLDSQREDLEVKLADVVGLISGNWEINSDYDDYEDDEYGECLFIQAQEDDDIEKTLIECGVYMYKPDDCYYQYLNYCSDSIYPEGDVSYEDIASDMEKIFGLKVSPEKLQEAVEKVFSDIVETGTYCELVEQGDVDVNDEYKDAYYVAAEGDYVDDDEYMAYIYVSRERVYY